MLTRTSPTDSRLVRKLVHTIHYAAPPKLRQMPPKHYWVEYRTEHSSFFAMVTLSSVCSQVASSTLLLVMTSRRLSRSATSCDVPAVSSFVQSFISWTRCLHVCRFVVRLQSLPVSVVFLCCFSNYAFKEPHLPLHHTPSEHETRPNLVQHAFVRFPLHP